ncbi:hypothetical protein ACWDPF_33625 [Streptomyces albogriseolus]
MAENQDQTAGLTKLRIAFPTEQIHHLPKIWCGDCSRSRTKVCENPRHAKRECKDCGNYITSAHVDLDYVGHAELTNRLLDADPLWNWEPVAFDADGLPKFDEDGGLWIRLTVCGHTRLGYGDSQGKRGPNAKKEAIGDALRNAAMRFGAALDLWAKSNLREAQSEHPKSAEDDGRTTTRPERETPAPRPEATTKQDPPPQEFTRLTQEYQRWWDDARKLTKIRREGKNLGLSEARVQGPPPESAWTTFDKLLSGRITDLEQQPAQAA